MLFLLAVVPPLILLVFGILLAAYPQWCLKQYVRWNAIFGVDVNRVISSQSRAAFTARLLGLVCVSLAVLMLIGAVAVLRSLG